MKGFAGKSLRLEKRKDDGDFSGTKVLTASPVNERRKPVRKSVKGFASKSLRLEKRKAIGTSPVQKC